MSPRGALERFGRRSGARCAAVPDIATLRDPLTASASEVIRTSRLATYRVDVAGVDGKIVAVFTWTTFITKYAHDALGRP